MKLYNGNEGHNGLYNGNERRGLLVPDQEKKRISGVSGIKLFKNNDRTVTIEFYGWRYQASKQKMLAVTTGITLNISYSAIVSLIYASLASERDNRTSYKVIYATSSFVMNFPMALLFGFDFFSFLKKLKHESPLYWFSTILGLLLALLTTIASVPLSSDAISKTSIDFVKKFGKLGVSTFIFNTLSTRFVGSAELINLFLLKCLSVIYRDSEKYEPLFQLLDDIRTYGKQLKNLQFTAIYEITEYANIFYQTLKENKILPSNKKPLIKNGSDYAIKTVAFYCAYHFIPLWLFLVSRGLDSLHINSDFVAYLSMLANQLFYVRSALDFKNVFVEFTKRFYTAVLPDNAGLRGRTITFLGTTLLIFLSVGTGFASGSGYGKEMANSIDDGLIHGNGTCPLPHDFYDSPAGMPMHPAAHFGLLVPIASMVAGVLVNWRAFTIGTNRAWNFFSKSPKNTLESFEKLLEEKIAKRNFDDMDQATLKEISDARKDWADWQAPQTDVEELRQLESRSP